MGGRRRVWFGGVLLVSAPLFVSAVRALPFPLGRFEYTLAIFRSLSASTRYEASALRAAAAKP
ncbi:MAG: hypothetical protein ACI8PT_000211 [Gammaproteobacteria bacterium]|jgi:hypothetical protein